MEESYRTTIEDFRVELVHLSPSDFRMKYYLKSQIDHYEKKLKELEETES
jgi:hypothetical protein